MSTFDIRCLACSRGAGHATLTSPPSAPSIVGREILAALMTVVKASWRGLAFASGQRMLQADGVDAGAGNAPPTQTATGFDAAVSTARLLSNIMSRACHGCGANSRD